MIGAIIQARMGSTRLPGKVLKSLPYGSEKLLIDQLIGSLLSINFIDKLVLATTVNSKDDLICEHIIKKYGEHVILFRGSEEDVLERYYLAAKENNLHTIFRFTADNPCVDANVVLNAYRQYVANKKDYLTTFGYPLGLDVEVFSFHALTKAYEKATLQTDRENVTSFIRHHPELFDIEMLPANEYKDISELRLTVDTDLDYILMCCVFDYYKDMKASIGLSEILALFKLKPWLFSMNKSVVQKRSYYNVEDETLHAISLIENLEMPNVLKRLKEMLNFSSAI